MSAVLTGFGASPGRVAGLVVTMPAAVPEPTVASLPPEADVEEAVVRLGRAVQTVHDDLHLRAGRATGAAAELLEVTAVMAADPSLQQGAVRKMRESRADPARAVWEAAGEIAQQLELLGGPMAERATDVRDVRDRIVAVLLGLPTPGVPHPGYPFVLVASDLSPADTATLDPERVRGIVTISGGPTSHTAILARDLGIPAVVAATGAGVLTDGETVLVDGSTGRIELEPSPGDLAKVQMQAQAASERVFGGVGRTADGARVQMLANIADPTGAHAALAAGAEGVGLFRTEFCFLGRVEEPTIEEQVAAYRSVFAVFANRKVVIRTLDAGADKPLAFLTAAPEPNPALGVRGLRTSWRSPDVLDRQLRAIALAAKAESAEVQVMAPMVATAQETADFVGLCAERRLDQAGVMIEVPSAALQSRWILEHAAFASIGTNDLTQYAMAADRQLADLAALSTPWQPAVLSLVRSSCLGGQAADRPVGVCGEAAADPALAPVLVGLGVSSLSMTARALADVGAVLARTTMAHCVELAEVALAQPSAPAAREAVRSRLPVLAELGL